MKAVQDFIKLLTSLAVLGAALSLIFYVLIQSNTNNSFVFGSNNKVDQKIETAPNTLPSPVPTAQPQAPSVPKEQTKEPSSNPEPQAQVSDTPEAVVPAEPEIPVKTETVKTKPRRSSDYRTSTISLSDLPDDEEADYQEVSQPVRKNCPRIIRYPVQVQAEEGDDEDYQDAPVISRSSRTESYQETNINGRRTVRRVVTTRDSQGVTTTRVYDY